MTRETKIGLLLGMGVILLIGIIISDQLAQPQQAPADFTGFAAESQRSIDASDAAPTAGYTGAPGTTVNDRSPAGTTVIDPPSNFFIPSHQDASPRSPRQANGSPTGPSTTIDRPLTAYRVDETPNASRNPAEDSVPTLRLGQGRTELPHDTAVIQTPHARSAQVPAPRGPDSVIRHKVLKNETLTKLARRYYGNGDYWRTIARANADKVTLDGRVRLGAVLKIPKRNDAVLGPDFINVGSEQAIRVDTRTANPSGKTIEVQAGDTLSELAGKHLGSATRWRDLLDANRDQLKDPQGLRVGMKLRLPGTADHAPPDNTSRPDPSKRTPAGKTYTVRPGDNLTAIAEKTLGDGGKWRRVYQANRDKLKSPDRLIVGQELKIPG